MDTLSSVFQCFSIDLSTTEMRLIINYADNKRQYIVFDDLELYYIPSPLA